VHADAVSDAAYFGTVVSYLPKVFVKLTPARYFLHILGCIVAKNTKKLI
jgi:hypothetical protein